ncbi:hypothetical protein N7493_007584 [Penicillium malachiteum]|uniref:Aminoglycoside phosphotransferase domain-containing protein n=1 Tax=Penicillium malachiteum TaxID=1324776 RepID=A0AAD6HHZ1_9EURO|nr:hypothetical protein N7493_007584 [Penicillium malachiteum]
MEQPTFHEKNIPLAVSQIRADGQVPTTSEQFVGINYRVFKVDFSDNESWAIRVPLVSNLSRKDWPQSFLSYMVDNEAQILKELEEKGFEWAPRYCGHDSTFDNSIGSPFIAVTWLSGNYLEWTEESPQQPLRNKILEQLAEIHISLIECTKYTGEASATDHFKRIIENKVTRIRSGKLPELTEQDVSAQMDLLLTVLLPELEAAPFAVTHTGFGTHNIIMDKPGVISGVVSWAFAEKRPLQYAAGFPEILLLRHVDQPPSEILRSDRENYIAALRSRNNSEIVETMISILSAEDVEFNTMYLESIVSKSRHREMADAGWGDAPAVRGD